MPILESPLMSIVPQNPTPAAAGLPTQSAAPTIEALQTQITSQAQQLAVLQAQQAVLQRQINRTSPGPALDALIAQRTPLDNDILKLQIDLAGSKAQLASRLGISADRIGANGRLTQQPFQDFGSRRGPDPDAVVGMSFALIIAVAFPLSIAYARRIWRGKPSASAQTDTVSPRLDRIEQAVEAIAIEIERVAEGQRFVTKVFAERPAQAQAQANVGAESPIMRDAAPPLAEAKPFLALGAGPIEPIRVPERQTVRPSITPH